MRLWDRLIRRYGDTFWEGQASGAAVLSNSYGAPDREPVLPQLTAFAQQAYASSSPVFSASLVRMALFSEARFAFQAKDDKHLFGNQSLAKLEVPFGPGTTTGHLLARMEQDAFLMGQAYIWDPPGEGRLVRLRPDWVTIVSEVVRVAPDGWYRRPAGFWFQPPASLFSRDEGFMVPAGEVVHWAPIPDPLADFRGMAPLTPVVRDVQGDDAMARFKIRYLANNATPNIVIRYAQKLQPATVDAIRDRVSARYGGPDNAGKTLVLDQGADLTLAGNSLSQMDFSNVQSAGDERVLAALSVPGVLVGLEPLRGAGRGYQESMQKLANIWARPQWRSACGALEQLVDTPSGNRLWFDVSDIAALHEGEMARAQASLVRMQAILAGVQAGFTHESVVAAQESGDLALLKAGGMGTPGSSQPVQHLLPQAQPGATADPLPAGSVPRLAAGSTSPGDGGNGTRPIGRPSSVRRALQEANGHG